MNTYLVGGAVRDQLLGYPVRERDWLVTGVTGEQLRALGYRQVGKHFPVFLHPLTHEEYALPRHARGGDASQPASVEEDLQRRDLTINAMALAEDGSLIDPCGGQQDLQQRLLRHTPAFRDDPIRLLRAARFAARYHELGFRIADDTRQLMQQMVDQGDLADLVPERTFSEIARALEEEQAQVFFQVLRECGALALILPEVDRLFGVPQPPQYHPEIDTGVHTLMVLQQACRLSEEAQVRFAALLHDVGKGTTPEEEWPRHIGHEARGVALIDGLAQRLRIPNDWRDLASACARYHLHGHRALQLKPASLLKLLDGLDALRRPQRFEQFLLVCIADMRGRSGLEDRPYPQADYLRGALDALARLDNRSVIAGTKGRSVEETLRRAQLRELAAFKQNWQARNPLA